MTPSSQPSPAASDVTRTLARAIELHQRGRVAEAEALYRVVLAADPDQADALHFLGLIRFAGGELAEALRLIAKAMQANASSPTMLLNHGIVLNALGRQAEAIASFDRAIALEAGFLEAHNARGVLLAELGRHEEALQSYRRALAIAPDHAEINYNLGNALKAQHRYEAALAGYDKALAAHPHYAEALCNRGVVLEALGRPVPALESYDRAVALRPDLAEAHCNRGNALTTLKRYAEALTSYERALALRPHYPEALSGRGNVLHETERDEEALQSFDRALALRPDYAEALSNRGAVLHRLKRYGEALACFDRALAVAPDDAEALSNRGATLSELRRHDEALTCYDRALAIRPDLPEVHWNQATLRLLTGDFRRGWAEYEWRWKRENLAKTVRAFPQPRWMGEHDISGKTILLHSEQGFGDTIQFCRYAPLVAARGARLLLEVERPLCGLMASLAGPTRIIAKGDSLPEFDLHTPLLSLPLAFGTELHSVPAQVPYLQPAAQAVARWQTRLGTRSRARIGLVWSGNPSHPRDAERSIALRGLLPLLEADATFVSLQKDVRPADAAFLRTRADILQIGDLLTDFSETAALIAQLDLIVAVDTGVAHLAGALGKPVWLLLQHTPDWRWLLERDDSPWYPTARLFRQDATRTWDNVIADVTAALRTFLS